jgi:hypothetical protein
LIGNIKYLIMSPNAVASGQIRIEDKLYSVQKLADIHPGGPLFIKVGLLSRWTYLVPIGSLKSRYVGPR